MAKCTWKVSSRKGAAARPGQTGPWGAPGLRKGAGRVREALAPTGGGTSPRGAGHGAGVRRGTGFSLPGGRLVFSTSLASWQPRELPEPFLLWLTRASRSAVRTGDRIYFPSKSSLRAALLFSSAYLVTFLPWSLLPLRPGPSPRQPSPRRNAPTFAHRVRPQPGRAVAVWLPEAEVRVSALLWPARPSLVGRTGSQLDPCRYGLRHRMAR